MPELGKGYRNTLPLTAYEPLTTIFMEKLFQYLNFLIAHCRRTIEYFDKKNLNSIQFSCICLLERLSNPSIALKTLLEKINSDQSLEYACGIIVRSTLLDTLIVLNFYNILIENESGTKAFDEKKQIAEEFCAKILSDGLDKTLNYINIAKDLNVITQQQLEEAYKNFVSGRENYFKPYANDGSRPVVKNKKYYSPTDLFRRIANNSKLKELSKIYDSYLFFSKYDHFSVLYYEVWRQDYIKKLERIHKAVELFILTQSILHLVLRLYSDKDEFMKNQSYESSKYLNDNFLIDN